jgi:hypothetical protein
VHPERVDASWSNCSERQRQRLQPQVRAITSRSQREGQLDDANYQTAYQPARTVSVNGGRGCPIVASWPVHHTGLLSMAQKRKSGSSLLSPTCLGGYPIFGGSMHRTLMLEAAGIGRHPGAGGSHCSIPHLKPDKQLLINSQAVYRPSLVENSRVTMSSVEQ